MKIILILIELEPTTAIFFPIEPINCLVCRRRSLLGWADFRVRPLAPGFYDLWTRLVWGPKYDGEALKEAINNKLKDVKLEETVTRILVPTFDVYKRSVIIFDSRDNPHQSTIPLAHVCIATTAAPVYFPAHEFKHQESDAKKETEYNLIDGGVAANNPTQDAIWSIIKEATPQVYFKKLLVISIGTGSTRHMYKAEECRKWGLIGWLYKDGHNPLLDIFSKNTASMIHYTTGFFFRLYNCQENYLRIDPEVHT